MAPTLFDIYLTGRLATGMTAGDAAQRLAQMFRTTPEAAANLVTGKPQLIKRGVDPATAEKYRSALQRAGLEIDIRSQPQATEPPPTGAQPAAPVNAAGLTLAPAGTDLLTPTERSPALATTIDTSHIKLAPQIFQPLGPDNTARPRPEGIDAPDFSLAPVGGDLLQPEEKSHAPTSLLKEPPAIPDLTLAEAGALLETLPKDEVALTPDIARLSLAPAEGVLVKPEELPAKPTAPLPDISHLRLRD